MVELKKLDKLTVRRTLHYFWTEIKKYKWLSLGCFVLTPIVIFARSILIPLVLATMIGKVSDGVPSDKIFEVLLPDAIFMILSYIIGGILLGQLRLYCCWKMEVLAMYDLSGLCFDTINAQSMQFHNDRFSGSLVSQTNKFVSAFERFVDLLVWSLIPLVCMIVFTMVVLFPLAPIVACIMLGLVFIYTFISWFTFKQISHLNALSAEASTKETGQLSDSISNILSVKSYAQENHEKKRYAKFRQKSLVATTNVLIATLKRDVVFSFVNVGLIGAVLFFLMVGNAWFGLSVATLILIVNYSQQILGNLWDINNIFRGLNRTFGDCKEMIKILDMPDDVVDEEGATKLIASKGAVEFKNISFKHYDAKESIFENFELEIKPGERVGLVGVSGSGKTTLTKLLLRFADVNTGEVLIDGQNIRTATQQSLRECIAYVPQETALFHRSISENIAYAKPNATKAEIERAAKLANAAEFISQLPDGYDTLVGERGVKLSGGQRQRIAIARAILKDAPILVLDEATSALDSESESLIQSALMKLMSGRTSIVIAHRLSTVASLDRIVLLENGKIVEQGTHQELLKMKNGGYKKLWEKQSGSFISGQ